MRLGLVALATLLGLLAGCGEDPIVAGAREAAGQPTPGGGAATPGPADAPPHGEGVPDEPAPAPAGAPRPGEAAGPAPGDAGTPQPGVPEPPKPGNPNEPPPGQVAVQPGMPGQPAPGIPEEPKPGTPGSPGAAAGPTVEVRGKVSFDAYSRGEVRIDAFDGDHSRHGSQPGIVASIRLPRPGDFVLAVPQGTGKVYVEAAIDEDGDGKPGPQDPQGRAERYPVTVGESPVDGLRINLKKQAPPPSGEGKGKGDDF